jgi:Domain of unknown function (DUF4326)
MKVSSSESPATLRAEVPEAPVRIQLSRKRGWRLPENTVVVSRPSKWGNPFVIGKPGGAYAAKVMDRRHAWQLYHSVATNNETLIVAARAQLAGKNLACWCPLPTEPYAKDECHAAVLLELANASGTPAIEQSHASPMKRGPA